MEEADILAGKFQSPGSKTCDVEPLGNADAS